MSSDRANNGRNYLNLATMMNFLMNNNDDDVVMGNTLSSSSSSVGSTLDSFLSSNNNSNKGDNSNYFMVDRGASAMFPFAMGSRMTKTFDEDIHQYMHEPYLRDLEVEKRLKQLKEDFNIE